MIEAGGVIEARVPGRGGDGGPNCATVKDFDRLETPKSNNAAQPAFRRLGFRMA